LGRILWVLGSIHVNRVQLRRNNISSKQKLNYINSIRNKGRDRALYVLCFLHPIGYLEKKKSLLDI
jgi:hypothetical protein